MKKINLFQSIPLGIGSIIGSGILFLPSLTYRVSGPDVLISWLLIIILCVPGIVFFNEMIKLLRPDNCSLSGMVELGLGREVGISINLILLGTVIFGMPSAAIVAGSYCSTVFDQPCLNNIVPFILISFALAVNFFGLKASAIISSLISAIIVIISIYLINTTKQPISSYVAIKPVFNLNNIYSGAVLSFWAFAGFENLTFLYDKFNKPRRDLIITIIVSIFVCGLLYLGLVANYSAIVPFFEIKQTIGLIQMVEFAGKSELPLLIAIFAVLAVAINLVSWTSGVVQLIIQGSKQGILPSFLKDNEKKSLFLLACLFYSSTFLGLSSPYLFEKILTTVSSNFLVIYLLLIVSFIIVTKTYVWRFIAVLIVLSILVTLSSSSYLLLYPFLLFLYSYLKTRNYVEA